MAEATAILPFGAKLALRSQDPRLKAVFAEVYVLAPLRLAVLILGPTGSGKEGIARALHWLGPRKEKPFIAVNCAAITETLATAEFFGSEKHAYTGAFIRHVGYFEAAAGGTLFLDEIADLPPNLQVMLLRALQEREITPVGSTRSIKVDFRLVCATNRNLPRLVSKGKFREDLFHRIATDCLFLPSLRDRPDDVLDLACSFAVDAAREYGIAMDGLDDDLRDWLLARDWPGNVRQLKARIESAVGRHSQMRPESRLLSVRDLSPGALELDALPRADRPNNADAAAADVRDVVSTHSSSPCADGTILAARIPPDKPPATTTLKGAVLGAAILAHVDAHGATTIPALARALGREVCAIRRQVARLSRQSAIVVVARVGRQGALVSLRSALIRDVSLASSKEPRYHPSVP